MILESVIIIISSSVKIVVHQIDIVENYASHLNDVVAKQFAIAYLDL